MSSGENIKAWFPEMIEVLKNKWISAMPWSEYIKFCKEMTAFRNKIRADREIKPAMMWCKKCNDYHPMQPLPIPVRSMLYALNKNNIIDNQQFEELDLAWGKYCRQNKLDKFGKKK